MKARLHPLLVLAAISVIVFSVVGVAAIFGKIPGAESRPGDPVAQSSYATPQSSYPTPQNSDATPMTASNAVGPSSAQRPASPMYAQPPQYAQAPAPCANCGVIQSIRTAQVTGQTSGVGAVAGGVAGGLLGNQIGRGDGRTIATIAGAAGGAYVGNAIEKNTKKRTVYRVTLRMDDGRQRTLSQREAPPYAVGDRVRIANGRIIERA